MLIAILAPLITLTGTSMIFAFTVSVTDLINDLKEKLRITMDLVRQAINEMDLDPAALAEVEEAFIGAGLL